MQNSESGRKLNQAVNTTSRAVGGAISTAKGAFSTWWTSITAAVPATAPAAESSAQSGNAQSNSNNNNNGDQYSESSDCDDDDPDPENSSYSDSDQSQSDGPPASSRPIATAELTAERTNNIIEIGKEAELLDRKQKILDV